MQQRLFRLAAALTSILFSTLLVILSFLTLPVAAAGPDVNGNGVVSRHTTSARRSASSIAYLPSGIIGTHYIYVNNGSSPNSISAFKLHITLTELPGSPYATGGMGDGTGFGGNQLAISPDHQCVFASDDGSGTFNAFQINTDGSLTQIAHVSVETTYIQAVAVSPLGDVVFVSMYVSPTSGPVDSFSIGAGCSISEAQSTDIGNAMGSLAISPDGTKLFVSSYIGGFINTYAISGTSFTLLNTSTAQPSSPSGLTAVGDYLYSGNAAIKSKTGAYTIGAGGELTPLPGSPARDGLGSNSAQVWYDHVNKQLISSEQYSNSFGIYAMKNGTYTFLAHVKAGRGTFIRTVATAMAQINDLLLVTNDDSDEHNIILYGVAPGSLAFIADVSLPSGTPNGIAAF